MYYINFDKEAKNSFKKIDKSDQKKILNKIHQLNKNPYIGKRLAGNLFGLRRLRVDKYRVLYKIIEDKLIIIIINISHRKNIY